MPFPLGTRLGPYEITSALGAGGMGEVYRATDSQLKRSVAIKILPAAVAGDADRIARFEREAQLLAALNHPNIAAVYGLERTPDLTALVMELVEGEDLSAVIARGPILLADALPIARQIAEALEAAHEQSIIHRDLKPANVKVRADGTVKVLDFGLAKAMSPDLKVGPTSGDANSPTIVGPTFRSGATQMGVILGTAAYMAPEQAKGRSVDKRADIWAFGVVLYEMLTGRRAFEGEDVSDLLVAVLSKDVDLGALPAATPPAIVALIRRCLARDPKKRLRDIGEARLILEDPNSLEPATGAPVAGGAVTAPIPLWRRPLPYAMASACFAVLFAVALLMFLAPGRSTPSPESRRLLASVGADAYIVLGSDDVPGSAVAVSPDGRTLVFLGARKVPGSRPQLFVRRLDQLQATPLEGTEGAFAPFFSPDSQWVAFFVGGGSDGLLRKIPVAGGASQKICAAFSGRGGAWAADDTIVFGHLATPATPLMRVPAAGGTPVAFGAFGEGASSQRWPQILPGGTHVLYTEHSGPNRFDYANLVVAPLPGLPGEASATGAAPKFVVRGGFYGRYVAIGPNGYLTYVRQNTVMAMPFDLSRLEATGPAVPVVEGVVVGGSVGSASVAISPDGTLVYVPTPTTSPVSAAGMLSRDGKVSLSRTTVTRPFGRLSPDGQQLAFADGAKERRLFVVPLTRDVPTPVTAQGGASNPVWTPDGKRLAFGLDSGVGVSNLWMSSADGSGAPIRLTTSPHDQQPGSWDPSGKVLAYTEIRPDTARDVLILPVEGNASQGWTAGTPVVFKGTAVNERDPAFSPDGRWIAYISDDVYVSPFPGPGATVRISTGGGSSPQWSAASHELLFLSSGKIMSVSYAATDTFTPGTPKLWAPQDALSVSGFLLHPDGKRAAVALVDAEAVKAALYARDKVVFWSGFFDYLRKNVVVKK